MRQDDVRVADTILRENGIKGSCILDQVGWFKG